MDRLREVSKRVPMHHPAYEFVRRASRLTKFSVSVDILNTISAGAALVVGDGRLPPLPYREMVVEVESFNSILVLTQTSPDSIAIEVVIGDGKEIFVPESTAELQLVGTEVRVHTESVPMKHAESYSDIYRTLASITLRFLGVLYLRSCTTTVRRADRAKNAQLPKGVIPFSDYHVLRIKSTDAVAAEVQSLCASEDRHSPREHTRRAHLRRLASGAVITVSSTVVNKGVGSRLEKDYAL